MLLLLLLSKGFLFVAVAAKILAFGDVMSMFFFLFFCSSFVSLLLLCFSVVMLLS